MRQKSEAKPELTSVHKSILDSESIQFEYLYYFIIIKGWSTFETKKELNFTSQ